MLYELFCTGPKENPIEREEAYHCFMCLKKVLVERLEEKNWKLADAWVICHCAYHYVVALPVSPFYKKLELFWHIPKILCKKCHEGMTKTPWVIYDANSIDTSHLMDTYGGFDDDTTLVTLITIGTIFKKPVVAYSDLKVVCGELGASHSNKRRKKEITSKKKKKQRC